MMMTEQRLAGFLPVSHREALRLLSDGLCRIREAAVEAPEHAMQMADALHNLPGILAGEDRADEAYLAQLVEKGQLLLDDRSWRNVGPFNEKHSSETNPTQRKWIVIFAASVATLGTLAIAFWFVFSGSTRQPLDTSVLALDAPGCVATKPDGESIKSALERGDTAVPKGTLLTPQCFKQIK
jgi:hypothetical protein